MGICYYICKPAKKERFNLDKGSWFNIFPRGGCRLILAETREHLSDVIRRDVYPPKYSCMAADYYSYLADKIIQWCGSDVLYLTDDAGDDEAFGEDWKLTGDRFRPTRRRND